MTLGDPSSDPNHELSESARHDLLASDLRRELLGELGEEGAGTDLPLAELAARVTTDRRQREVEVELHHLHLPKLDALDLVEYDPVQERVSTNAPVDQFDVDP